MKKIIALIKANLHGLRNLIRIPPQAHQVCELTGSDGSWKVHCSDCDKVFGEEKR